MNLPIRPGTARRLGIRQPYQAYPQRIMLGSEWDQQNLKPFLDAMDNLNRQVALAALGIFRPVRHMGGLP